MDSNNDRSVIITIITLLRSTKYCTRTTFRKDISSLDFEDWTLKNYRKRKEDIHHD